MAARKNSKNNDNQEDCACAAKSATKKKAASKSSTKSSKGSNEGMSFLKKCLFAFMFAVIIILAVGVYFMVNFDTYSAKLAEKIEMTIESVNVDPAKLVDKQTKLKMCMKANNTLPIAVDFKQFTFDMSLGDSQVAKGMQAETNVTLAAGGTTNVNISCNVDSIIARRAIQKALEKNAGQIFKSLLNSKNIKQSVGDDIKAITVVKGKAEFKLKLGPLEIPFSRAVTF